MKSLVIATSNPHKVEEIAAVLGQIGIECVPMEAVGIPEPEEDGATFEANARIKAVAYAKAIGRTVLADDSGLEVDALDGAPGVRSARYAGEPSDAGANIAKLLTDLQSAGAQGAARTARCRTVMLITWPDGTETLAEGVVNGTIATEPRGDGGFGYDPVFIPDEGDGRTFAQMQPAEKHAISHRGRALRALIGSLS